MFDGSVSAEYLDRILSMDPPLSIRAEDRVATVFFSDVIGATQLVESQGFEKVRTSISQLLEVVAKDAIERGGYVDKFVGDEAMIVFGAPESVPDARQAIAAVELAFSVLSRARELNLEVAVGINTGPMSFGNYGSETKPNYSPFGKEVNLAARMEGWSRRTGHRPTVTMMITPMISLRKSWSSIPPA